MPSGRTTGEWARISPEVTRRRKLWVILGVETAMRTSKAPLQVPTVKTAPKRAFGEGYLQLN